MSAMRSLSALMLLVLIGCAGEGTVEIEIALPVGSPGELLRIQVATDDMPVDRVWSVPAESIVLSDTPQTLCIRTRGPAGPNIHVRMRQCATEICAGGVDDVPRVHTAVLEEAIYSGKTTRARLSFRPNTAETVLRCRVGGCTTRDVDEFCDLDGRHFCQFLGDEALPTACDVIREADVR